MKNKVIKEICRDMDPFSGYRKPPTPEGRHVNDSLLLLLPGIWNSQALLGCAFLQVQCMIFPLPPKRCWLITQTTPYCTSSIK